MREINADSRKKITRCLNVSKRAIFERDNFKEG